MAERRTLTWQSTWGAPRLLTRDQVRGYLQTDVNDLTLRMRRGQLPVPLWGCDPALPSARWDRKALERAVDRASAIPSNDLAGEEELDIALGTRRRG